MADAVGPGTGQKAARHFPFSAAAGEEVSGCYAAPDQQLAGCNEINFFFFLPLFLQMRFFSLD